eukprot:scaffold8070_cov117-Cylindrotheca_fusiformis.AAC.16
MAENHLIYGSNDDHLSSFAGYSGSFRSSSLLLYSGRKETSHRYFCKEREHFKKVETTLSFAHENTFLIVWMSQGGRRMRNGVSCSSARRHFFGKVYVVEYCKQPT